jgi:hypothetical protein
MELPTVDFNEFPKMSRLNREVIVTEKIDGTNAQIYIPDASEENYGKIFAGSRTKWIQPGKQDNMGFAGWVERNAGELMQLGPGNHFGEWWGKGIQRGYAMPDKRFSLFNVHRWGGPNSNLRPACCGVVPTLWTGNFENFMLMGLMSVMNNLAQYGSVASPGFMDPEGIVVFHTAQGILFKKTLKNDESPKSLVK